MHGYNRAPSGASVTRAANVPGDGVSWGWSRWRIGFDLVISHRPIDRSRHHVDARLALPGACLD
jgi:hypothetical protein